MYLTNNTCSGNERNGIDVGGKNNSVIANDCSINQWNGIYIEGSNNTIMKNSCIRNEENGIHVYQNSQSAFLTLNDILNNTCTDNLESGICMSRTNESSLTGNIMKNNTHGLLLENCVVMTITHNIISGNELGCEITQIKVENYYYISKYIDILNNSIWGNSVYGLLVSQNGDYEINATMNYWGSDTGPFHVDVNPKGEGDNISGLATIEPWLDEYGGIYQVLPEDPDTKHDDLPLELIAALIGTGAFAFLLVYLISEPFRFFLTLHLLPLYTRLKKEKIDQDIAEGTTRGGLYKTIASNPGINLTDLQKKVAAGYGTTVYHLSVLNRSGYINVSRNGRRKLFWCRKDYPGSKKASVTDVQKEILSVLSIERTITRKEIQEKTGLASTTLHTNLRKLTDEGKVVEVRSGNLNVYSLTDGGREMDKGDSDFPSS